MSSDRDSDSSDNDARLLSNKETHGEALRLKKSAILMKCIPFFFLSITTAVSTVLLVASVRHWAIEGSAYGWWFNTILNNRAAIQSAIQICAATLGLIHALNVASLIQHATSLSMINGAGFTSDSLRARVNMSILRWQWGGPFRHVVPVLAMCSLGLVSSALWVGAITPISDTKIIPQTVVVPSYSNTSLIREYPSQINRAGPSITTREGHFTYSVGVKLLGSLISSGATATTADGSIRRHPKIDNTQFFYQGRSYGAGAGVGITDDAFANMPYSSSYQYSELGYVADVACIHNASTDYTIGREFPTRIFAVQGVLPDSGGVRLSSEYYGHSDSAIVALGVSYTDESPRRYMAIAAGESYRALNATQCTVDFSPMLLDVHVDLGERSMNVTPARAVPDFDPGRNLTRTAMRQFELIAADLTNVYESVLGNAFLSSISAWNISSNGDGSASEDEAALRGLESSVTAMADSMLAAYGAAQLMVGNFSETREAELSVRTFVIGQEAYIVAVVVLNAIILLIVLEEAVRTRGWAGLPSYDFTDPEWLTTAAYRGGIMTRKAGDPAGETSSQPASRMPWRYTYYVPAKDNLGSWLKAVPFGNGGEVALRLKAGPPRKNKITW